MNDDLVLVRISAHTSTRLDGATVGMTESLLYAVGAEIGRTIEVGENLRFVNSDFALFTNLENAIRYYDSMFIE